MDEDKENHIPLDMEKTYGRILAFKPRATPILVIHKWWQRKEKKFWRQADLDLKAKVCGILTQGT